MRVEFTYYLLRLLYINKVHIMYINIIPTILEGEFIDYLISYFLQSVSVYIIRKR